MSRCELYFHIVWATRERRPYLTQEKEAAVYRLIISQTMAAGCELLELNGMPDHVYLLLRSGPVFDIPKLMKQIKGVSSAMLNSETYNNEYFRWQEGYFAVTVTPSHLGKLRAYIQDQKEHHQTGYLRTYWEDT